MVMDIRKSVAERVSAFALQRVTRVYPRGALLFRRGQVPTGVFYIQDGTVDLSPTARDTDQITTGSLLGLSELFAGSKYENSAICRSLTRVIYVEKEDLF